MRFCALKKVMAAHLIQAELLGIFAEDEEHGVDDVGLAGTVGADDGGEALVEWPHLAHPAVTLEVLQHHFRNEQPRRVRLCTQGRPECGCGEMARESAQGG